MSGWTLGVLGGSGLQGIEGVQDVRRDRVDTPWGAPSDELTFGTLHGVRLVFLPRHGLGHRIPPSQVNYRANVAALKIAGCTDLLSISAVGSLREELPPGTFLTPDQYVDRTFARATSFFGEGLVAHVSVADPVCPRLAGLAANAAREAGATVVAGGTYLCMEGPQFSTRAESRLHRAWGCDVVGMTNMPEAKLAREAELPYASLCMVTDYDSWRDGAVDVPAILQVMHANAARGREAVRRLVARLTRPREPSPIDTCLDWSIVTAQNARDPAMVDKLRTIAGRALGS